MRDPPRRAGGARAEGPVSVLYAGSLINLMEHDIGPAFDKTDGYRFQGFAGDSNGLANQIKGGLRRGDVFVSAPALPSGAGELAVRRRRCFDVSLAYVG